MNKYMLRKIQIALLALFMALPMTACDNDDDEGASGPFLKSDCKRKSARAMRVAAP